MNQGKISPLLWCGLGSVAGAVVLIAALQYPQQAKNALAWIVPSFIGASFMRAAQQNEKRNSPDDEPELDPEFVPLPPPLPPFTPMAERELELVEVEYFQPAPLKAMELDFDDDRK